MRSLPLQLRFHLLPEKAASVFWAYLDVCVPVVPLPCAYIGSFFVWVRSCFGFPRFLQAQLHFFVDGARKSFQDLASTSLAQFLFGSFFANVRQATPETPAPEMPILLEISAGGLSKPEQEVSGGVWLDVLGFLSRAASQHRPLLAAAGQGTSIFAPVLLSVFARRGAA